MSERVYMRYRVIKDLPGYLRVRYGRYAFADEEGYGIAEQLCRVLGVVDVRTAPANGSVLVKYDTNYAQCRKRVFEVLDSLERGNLPLAKPSDEQAKQEVTSSFIGRLSVKATS